MENKMEKDSFLQQMLDIDFETPVTVTIIYEDDDEIEQKSDLKLLENKHDETKEKDTKKEDKTTLKRGRPKKRKLKNKNLQINEEGPIVKSFYFDNSKTTAPTSQEPPLAPNPDMSPVITQNNDHNVGESESSAFIEQLLDTVSENLVHVIQAHNSYAKIKHESMRKCASSEDLERSRLNYASTRDICFNSSYGTVASIFLPHEDNIMLTTGFLKNTMKIAKARSVNVTKTVLEGAFMDLIRWAKFKKNEISQLTYTESHLKEILQSPNKFLSGNTSGICSNLINKTSDSTGKKVTATTVFIPTAYERTLLNKVNKPLTNAKCHDNTNPSIQAITNINDNLSKELELQNNSICRPPPWINNQAPWSKQLEYFSQRTVVSTQNVNHQSTSSNNQQATTVPFHENTLRPIPSNMATRQLPLQPQSFQSYMQGKQYNPSVNYSSVPYPTPNSDQTCNFQRQFHNFANYKLGALSNSFKNQETIPIPAAGTRTSLPPNTPNVEISYTVNNYHQTPNSKIGSHPFIQQALQTPYQQPCAALQNNQYAQETTFLPPQQRNQQQPINQPQIKDHQRPLPPPYRSPVEQYNKNLPNYPNYKNLHTYSLPVGVNKEQVNQDQNQKLQNTRSMSADSGINSPLNFNSTEEMITQDQTTSDDGNMIPVITHVTSLNPNAAYLEEKNCHVCKTLTRKKCIGCLKVYYCSQVCQLFDWNSHRDICQ